MLNDIRYVEWTRLNDKPHTRQPRRSEHTTVKLFTITNKLSAFRALISSIAPETVPEGGGKLTPEAIQKLSEKLKEIVGEDAAKDFEHHRNEKGEVRFYRNEKQIKNSSHILSPSFPNPSPSPIV